MLATPKADGPQTLHASAVAVGKRGLLITGASGSGKSTLALQLIGLGATLVSDDRVAVHRQAEGGLLMVPPEPIEGLIEARGLGLLTAPATRAAAIAVVDLDQTETDRLPEPATLMIAGETLPLIRRVESPAFDTMLHLYLKGGRSSP